MALYNGNDTNNTLNGSASADEMYGYGGADTLNGLGGNDYLSGGSGNDTLNGGAGIDELHGGVGDDTYVFGAGAGTDIIDEWDDSGYGGNDQVLLSGLNQAEVTFQRPNPSDLVLTIKSTGEKLLVIDAFNPATSANVESYRFADGTLTLAQINTLLSTGGAGNDKIYGWTGNDTLTGNAGDDTLNGLQGNDVLKGGAGTDILHGGVGDDTYVFGVGSGNDFIDEWDDSGYGGNDQVQLTSLNKADVTLQRTNATDLTLTIKATGEKLIIKDAFYTATSANVESYRFADGTLTLAQVNTLLSTGGTGNDTLYGWTGNDTLTGNAGDDTLNGLQGNDVLKGGAGTDILHGGVGDDTYVFGAGSGNDTIDDWDDSGYGGNDQVQLTSLNKADVTFQRANPSDLTLTIKSTGEKLTILDAFSTATSANVESYSFADGTLTLAQVNTLLSTGGAGNDILYGWTGNDTLTGNAGDDTLNGLQGNDVLKGGAGADILHGGVGDDTYVFGIGSGNDTIDEWDDSGYGGNDQVQLTSLNKADVTFQRANPSDLTLTIKSTGEKLTILDAFSTAISANVESYRFADGTLTLAQINTLLSTGGAGNDTLYGWTTNDTLTGNAGNDILNGLQGNDILKGGAGADTLHGGLGDDTYVFEHGAGNDIIDEWDDSGYGGKDQVRFSNVLLTDVAGITRSGYDLAIAYGSGNQVTVQDYFSSTSAQVEQFQFAGGSTLDKFLIGTAANDTLTGSTTNDALVGLAGVDSLSGGAGNDLYFVDNAGDVITEAAGAGTDTVLTAINLTLADNVENLGLLTGAVTGTGNSLDNTLTGNAANNTLNGGLGNDVLNGRAGMDTLIGGDGNDTFVVDNAGDVVTETNAAAAQIDTVQSWIAYTLGANVENLQLLGTAALNGTGNGLNNTLYANVGNNVLDGGAGLDTVSYQYATASVTASLATATAQATGGSGSDTLVNIENLIGSAYNDTLTGNAGNNTLDGGFGNDILDGGLGTDTVMGGAGTDTLKGGAGADIFAFSTLMGGADTVQDFLSGTDKLRFWDGATGLKIGDGDHLIDSATVANAPGAFTNSAELVIVTPNIAGTITATSAAAAIGSASAAYALGATRLFAVDNGTDSALYHFQASDADAAVEANELTLVGTLQGTAQTTLADYAFA